MTDLEKGFAESLYQDPTDSVTWMALADWYEENNQIQRSELLRLWWTLHTSARLRNRSTLETRFRELVLQVKKPVVPHLVVSHGVQMALVPPGRFKMGSVRSESSRQDDEKRHEVILTKPFYLGIFPVTQQLYFKVTGQNPSHHQNPRVRVRNSNRFPVEMVSWEDAVAFCDRFSQLPKEQQAGRRYRLPTEAEWEYACREAGASTAEYSFGSKITPALVNHDGSVDHYNEDKPTQGYLARPTVVGSYPSNALGLHDMHGNVWEWCSDWYAEDYDQSTPCKDPTGPSNGDGRILRGGCWVSDPSYCRSSRRYKSRDGYRVNLCFGFRMAMTVEPASTTR